MFLLAFAISKFGDNKYVAHSGLIVAPEYRGKGLAKSIKTKIFDYSREKYPDARSLGLPQVSCDENQL